MTWTTPTFTQLFVLITIIVFAMLGSMWHDDSSGGAA